jgi:GTP-dependent dephospho-CoA kinase
MKFNHSIVAGTFDHLHSGHLKLLQTALAKSYQVSIGLTQSNLTQTKSLFELIESQPTRALTLKQFLRQATNFSIFPLTSPLKPANTSNQFDSIIASIDTQPTVSKINHLRLNHNLRPLKTHFINLVKSTDHLTLSSTRIRQGQVNRQGFAYHQVFPKNKKLTLPKIHRSAFKDPFSTLLKGSQSNLAWAGLQAKQIIAKNPPYMTIAVGDIAVISLLQQNIKLDLSLVDLKTNRQQLFKNLSKLGLPSTADHLVNNPAGSITPDLIKALTQSFLNFHQLQTILVKGEEDLAVLPAILLSPLNTAIFYGQPHQGLVYIQVTEANKQKALALLQKLT